MTLAMLSWGAHRTLVNTLESYQAFGISDREKIIFFQEISRDDKRIADKYGFKYIGSSTNVGIAEAYKKLVETATGDIFLFLENDWVALESGDRLKYGQELLYSGRADCVRYRHRRFPGHPLWTLQFKGTEYDRPTHLLDSVHWTSDPTIFPEIKKDLNTGFYITDSGHGNWTNNPTMFKTEFVIDEVLSHIGKRDVEVDIQDWWAEQDFIVAQDNIGVFTHRRIG